MAGIFNLRSINGNVCDAVADPPRIPDNKIPTKIPDVQPPNKDQCNKKEPNPPVNNQDSASANDSKSDEKKDETKDFKPSASKNNEKPKPAKETSNKINVNYKFKNCNVVNVGPQRKNIFYMNHFQNQNSPQNNGTWKKEFKEMSVQILNLSKSEKEITTEDMLLIKKHLGKWKEVAVKLDLSEGEIEQLYEDYKSLNTTEVVYQMLIKWHQKNSKTATIGRLVSAMWSCQAYDCVEKLAEFYSNR